MTARTYSGTATPTLTDSQVKEIFAALDAKFNTAILQAFLHGIYTGVVAVSLCAVASRNNYQDYRRPHFLVFTILLLYVLTTVGICCSWVDDIFTFITAGESFWTAFNVIPKASTLLTGGIVAALSTGLADATLIWRCWIVWGRSWCIVLVPIACTTLAIVSRGIMAYYTAFEPDLPPRLEKVVSLSLWPVSYFCLILVILLWCTILIIYRILRVGGAAGRIHVYQRLIKMLVEPASLYSAVLIVLTVLGTHGEVASAYIGAFMVAMRGIMPTMLVGRVAAGHARPDDSWSESSPTASLRFRNQPSSQNDSQRGVGSGQDISSLVRPDLEEGLEDSTEVRVEGDSPTASAHDCSACVIGISNSVDYSVV